MSGSDLYFFALGCALATLFFLTLLAVLGSVFNTAIPEIAMKVLNFCVGIFMLLFAYKNSKIDISEKDEEEAVVMQ